MKSSKSLDLIVQSSSLNVKQIVEKLKSILLSQSITLFALIDHSGEAQKMGLDLSCEQLLIFGDPKIGTLLMQENPSIGIELPLKILIWQESDTVTKIAYKNPVSLADIYKIKNHAAILMKMSQALEILLEKVKY